MTEGAPATRREPQQERSRDTVERILEAADQEIGEHGLAGASTTRIARRAGVSVGALYRFFDDKQSIAVALSAQYLADVVPAYEEAIGTVASLSDVAETMGVVVRRAARLQEQHPGYYRLTEEWAPELDDSPAHEVRERLIALFSAALRAAGATDSEQEVHRVVELCIETVRHTLVRCPPEPEAREARVAELERMLVAYLTDRFR